MTTLLWVILILAVVIILWLIMVYNGLIKLKNQVDESWSDIDVQLKRRHDLIPNLVESVKGYMKHEAGLLENITKARAQAMAAQNPQDLAKAEKAISGALGSILVAVENYPQLRASENFAKLQDELSDTENKIQTARRFFNGIVRDFNIKLQVFPNNLIAGMLGFAKRDFFELDSEEERKMLK